MAELAKAAIVTGASSGIGRALALAAARDGFAVLLVARRRDRLDDVARDIRALGAHCETLASDVTAPDASQRIVETALQSFGRIDVLANNAGGGAYGELLEQSDAAIEAQWQTHVAAPLRIARAALPHLERTRGALAFFGSGVARVPLPAFGAYPLVKAAVRAAAVQLRRELRSRGVAVIYVDPGVVASEFHARAGIAPPRGFAAAPADSVARAILRGIRRRSAVVNAVAWQTAGTVAGEWLGRLADPVVNSMRVQRASPQVASAVEPHAVAGPPRAPSLDADTSSFERALAPLARRMERVKLAPSFVREALVLDATIELGDLAMRWAGMPNKNERAALHEVLDALAGAGYLEPIAGDSWRVLRTPE